MKDTPLYKHDCDNCTFLGWDIDQDGTKVDAYFCPQNGMPTIILRASSEGSDYSSYPIAVINANLNTFAETPFVRNMLIAEDMVLFDRASHLRKVSNEY